MLAFALLLAILGTTKSSNHYSYWVYYGASDRRRTCDQLVR